MNFPIIAELPKKAFTPKVLYKGICGETLGEEPKIQQFSNIPGGPSPLSNLPTPVSEHSGLYRTVTKNTRAIALSCAWASRTCGREATTVLSKLLREKGWIDRRSNQTAINWVGITLAE
jgi:hypothetical protein